MRPYPGQDWYKVRKYGWNIRYDRGRLAQVSAVDKDYVYVYWSDTDSQTRVRVERFNRTTEWMPA